MESGDQATAARAASLQRRFLAEHLGRWVGRFASQVQNAATTQFYRGMAALLADFVGEEALEGGCP